MRKTKTRGFRLGRKLGGVFKWFIHSRARRESPVYQRLQPKTGPISKLCKWVHSLRSGARGLCSGIINSGYIPIGHDPIDMPKLPKGHLAVYVGEKGDDTSRVLVPVLYFNHPLFAELLREAEKVYGFDHPGGIQIPCPRSKLENVQMKIASASGGGVWRRRWS